MNEALTRFEVRVDHHDIGLRPIIAFDRCERRLSEFQAGAGNGPACRVAFAQSLIKQSDQVVGDHQGQRLAAIQHAVVIQRAKRRAVGCIGIGEGLIVAGEFGAVQMIKHLDHARQRQGFGRVDPEDPALGNRA